jgi:hypothetical protein
MFFLDQPTSGITDCTGSIDFYYCPSTSPDSLIAINQATSGTTVGNRRGVQFNVSNANTLPLSSMSAFSDLAGPLSSNPVSSSEQTADGFFDWGLSFFYGRNVYTSIWGVTAINAPPSGVSVPAGPWWAY